MKEMRGTRKLLLLKMWTNFLTDEILVGKVARLSSLSIVELLR